MTGGTAAAAPASPGAGRDRRPNIVMILTDDHAAHAISAFGSVVNRTPRIDEIGAHGARLVNCFATNSLCSPSRAPILTGTCSHVNGVTTLTTPIDAAQPAFISQLVPGGAHDIPRPAATDTEHPHRHHVPD
jgi:arylsulfatase A-like enzyme